MTDEPENEPTPSPELAPEPAPAPEPTTDPAPEPTPECSLEVKVGCGLDGSCESSRPHSATQTIKVARTYKDGGVVVKESDEDTPVEVRMAVLGAPMAKVRASNSMTLNLGNFESVKLEVAIELPCYVEELEEAFKTAKKLTDMKLNKEVAVIRNYRDSKAHGTPHAE